MQITRRICVSMPADRWLPDNLNAFLPEKADITPIERALAGFMGVI